MPTTCGVINCTNRAKRGCKSFFRLPALLTKGDAAIRALIAERRKRWILSIRRADLTENKLKWLRVCEDHFITGCPSKLEDVDDPDWIPSVNMGYPTNQTKKTRLSPYVEYLRNSIVWNDKSEKSDSDSQESSTKVNASDDNTCQDNDLSNDSDEWYFINNDESNTITKQSISSEEYESEEEVTGQNISDERDSSPKNSNVESRIIFVKAFDESKNI